MNTVARTVAVAPLIALFSAVGLAGSLPASKSAAQISTVTVCANDQSLQANNPCTNQNGSGVWFPIMTTQIKTSNVSDLFVGVSLVTGLFTQTSVTGNDTGSLSEAVAEGTVRVAVQIDPSSVPATGGVATLPTGAGFGFPDATGRGVTFDQRIQYMNANLGYIFTGACAASPTTCTLTPEQITVALDSTAAHGFNYILSNVGTGSHTVVVWAKADTLNTSSKKTANGGTAYSNAMFGLGSVTVDAVRLVNSFSCTIDPVSGAQICQ